MGSLKIFFAGLGEGFRDFSALITDIVNFALLFFVYFIGVGIVAILSRIAGKKFMNLKPGKSTWVKRSLSKMPMEEYRRMF